MKINPLISPKLVFRLPPRNLFVTSLEFLVGGTNMQRGTQGGRKLQIQKWDEPRHAWPYSLNCAMWCCVLCARGVVDIVFCAHAYCFMDVIPFAFEARFDSVTWMTAVKRSTLNIFELDIMSYSVNVAFRYYWADLIWHILMWFICSLNITKVVLKSCQTVIWDFPSVAKSQPTFIDVKHNEEHFLFKNSTFHVE